MKNVKKVRFERLDREVLYFESSGALSYSFSCLVPLVYDIC